MDTKGPTPEAIRHVTYIGRLTDSVLATEQKIRHHVDCARAEGASWRMIGTALNVSTQAAWEKYRTTKPEDGTLSGLKTLPLWDDSQQQADT